MSDEIIESGRAAYEGSRDLAGMQAERDDLGGPARPWASDPRALEQAATLFRTAAAVKPPSTADEAAQLRRGVRLKMDSEYGFSPATVEAQMARVIASTPRREQVGDLTHDQQVEAARTIEQQFKYLPQNIRQYWEQQAEQNGLPSAERAWFVANSLKHVTPGDTDKSERAIQRWNRHIERRNEGTSMQNAAREKYVDPMTPKATQTVPGKGGRNINGLIAYGL